MRPRELLISAKAAVLFPLFAAVSAPAFRKDVFRMDCKRYSEWRGEKYSRWNICRLFVADRAFRSQFYWRLGPLRLVMDWLVPGYDHLQFKTASWDVGGGLLIQHGFATIVNAERIGCNCKIYQQVTIGYSHALKAPVIGDNVEICCGAKVIGGVTIGDNVVIGANAVVVKDVPPNCVVAGVPARIVRQL